MVTTTEKSRGSLFGPIVLVGLGVLLLLSNFGILNFNLWELLFRFWPLFLVAAGLDLLLGRRTNGGALAALVIIVSLVIGGMWLGYVQSNAFESVGGQTIRQNLEGAQRARVNIDSSVSQMQITAGVPAGQLVEGAIALHNNEELKTNFSVDSGVATYSLKSDTHSFILPSFGRREDGLWNLRLNGETPIDLSVSTGVGSAELNLEQLTLTGLEVSTGVGEVKITLPARGNFEAAIEGGVGKILVLVPDTLAAHITADAGIGSVVVDGNYIHRDGEYISPDFESASQRVNLVIGGGVGPVTVQQVSKQ
ncbi:MAG: hypothetical protein DYG89_13665 [Caldilinea sp. CFX5]|nr:hypothetical protein [Caldilinea sp. CFX5]